MDFVVYWHKRVDLPLSRFFKRMDLQRSKFYEWKARYGKVNEHNAQVPRDFWLEDHEKKAIIDFYQENILEGYRRVTYMMMDRNIVAVSASSVYRVLSGEGLMHKWNRVKSKKGTGFVQPLKPHEHWHTDISYINICGTFYYLCSVLDGSSRYIVHWDIRKAMKEKDVEIIIQKARERFPGMTPRIISDNGPQFISRDFKEYIRICGMQHVRISPGYPQSNGKIERWHQSLKKECIRPKTPLSLDDAHQAVSEFVNYYNTKRLHSAIGYVTPLDKLNGRDKEIQADRERKLAQSRAQRKERRACQKRLLLTGKELEKSITIIG